MDQEDALADLLEPNHVKLLAYVLGDDIIGADETHWRLMQKDSSKMWWVWCLTTHDAAWYVLEPSRSAETIRGVLGEFEGVVMCDAYGAYASLAKGSEGRLPLAHCPRARAAQVPDRARVALAGWASQEAWNRSACVA